VQGAGRSRNEETAPSGGRIRVPITPKPFSIQSLAATLRSALADGPRRTDAQ